MAEDPRQQYAQMLSALPPNALERIKKEMRRRAALFALGGTVVIVGAFLTLQPAYLSTLIMLGGAAVALMGLLGMSRGMGCMAYVAGFFWLSAITCGASRGGTDISLYVLGGTAAAFALGALLIPKPKAQNPLADLAKMMQGGGLPGGMPPGFPFGGPPPGAAPPQGNVLGSQRPARERVIDVDAKEGSSRPAEKPDAGKKRK